MDKNSQRVMELAFIYSLPDIVQANPGRVKNRLDKLRKVCEVELGLCHRISNKELAAMEDRKQKFGKLTGWSGSRKHISTYASFCLALIDGKKYPAAIFRALEDIIDYYERTKVNRQMCYAAGLLAKEKWEGM